MREHADRLSDTMRELKQASGLTFQEIADAAGVSIDRVKKYFSGDLKNPHVADVMSLCILFEVPLDDILGNPYRAQGGDESEAKLRAEIDLLNQKLESAKKVEGLKDDAINRLDTVSRYRRRLTGVLLAFSTILVFLLLYYLTMDINNPDIGAFHRDHVTPLAFAIVSAIAVPVGMLLLALLQKLRRRKKEEK